jgi:RNA polymerase sigma factor (sigma-70 family)
MPAVRRKSPQISRTPTADVWDAERSDREMASGNTASAHDVSADVSASTSGAGVDDVAIGRSASPASGAPAAANETVLTLFKAQAARVKNFLRRRLRNDEDAEDATQEIFLRLWRQQQEGRLRDEAAAYMTTAAYNVAVDVERWRKLHDTEHRLTLDEIEVPNGAAEASEALFWRDGMQRFVDTLSGLPVTTQQVFVLHHVDGLTHPAIADRLGMSVRNVERHMARAIGHCEDALKDYLS